jgi:hypothetical protein
MSGFGIILSIYLQSRQINWTGFWNYFIYLSVRQANESDWVWDYFIGVQHVRAAYDVRAAVDVSIWANKSDGIWNYILSIYLQSILSICTTCRPQYMYDVRAALAVHVRIWD